MNNNPMFYAPCPNCQADGHYRQWRGISGHGMRIDSDAHSVVGSEVSALICTICGNIQLFVNPNDFYKQ
ncbi:hypothetical protein [Dictyobacter aurantiacus]|uniref:hypothetical protein n=1 Tax=Dictyobacter aurantiacus TaxID=1936993 RepID=UPI000F831B06|nr:hypothetical protein [Dictyobacter aurantiacus]